MTVEFYTKQLQYISDHQNNILPEHMERGIENIIHRLFVDGIIENATLPQRETLYQIINDMKINVGFLRRSLWY
jgi:hypothetical protein